VQPFQKSETKCSQGKVASKVNIYEDDKIASYQLLTCRHCADTWPIHFSKFLILKVHLFIDGLVSYIDQFSPSGIFQLSNFTQQTGPGERNILPNKARNFEYLQTHPKQSFPYFLMKLLHSTIQQALHSLLGF